MTAMNSERPNIVLVLTDQQRRDSLPCYGNCFTVAPGADAMAARGICLDAAYTPWPVCTPARGSMWTGVYPHAHGLIDNLYGVDDAFASHCRQYRTVWSMLQDTGYRTAHFGKWHLGEAHPPFFDVWHESFNSRKGHWIDGLPEGEYRPDRTTDAAVAFIDMQKNADRPFAMALSFYPPHDPYTAPARFYDPYRGRGVPFAGYYAAVSALDHCLDRVRTALADTRLAENTVLIFFSDHGDTFRYRPEGEHKFVCHDDAIRIPFIAEGPGIAPGRRCAAPVGLQDLTPTILDIAGANVPSGLHGRSILPLLRGRDAPDWPQAGYVQNITHVSAIHQRALRSEGWKLILSATGDHELYDLAADPEEVLNIFLTPRADAGFDRFSHYTDQARIIEGLLSQMVAEAARIADNEGAAMVATARTSLAPRLAALSV
jgi:arylsulfatase A-like enzyme